MKLVGVAKGVQVEMNLLPGEEVVVRNEVISWDFAHPEIKKQNVRNCVLNRNCKCRIYLDFQVLTGVLRKLHGKELQNSFRGF